MDNFSKMSFFQSENTVSPQSTCTVGCYLWEMSRAVVLIKLSEKSELPILLLLTLQKSQLTLPKILRSAMCTGTTVAHTRRERCRSGEQFFTQTQVIGPQWASCASWLHMHAARDSTAWILQSASCLLRRHCVLTLKNWHFRKVVPSHCTDCDELQTFGIDFWVLRQNWSR